MAFNGSGQFMRLYNWQNDAANGLDIVASRMDGEMDGFAAGLSNCITRDGQSPPTAPINFGAQALNNVGAFSATNAQVASLNVTAGISAGAEIVATNQIRVKNAAGDQLALSMQPDHNAVIYLISAAGAQLPIASVLVGSQALGFVATPTVAGNRMWHAGNDGAGSGLDADLLDGRVGSFYTNVPARLGYTPYDAANPSGYISAISAGMVAGALGYTPANKGGEAFSGAISAPAVYASANANGQNFAVGNDVWLGDIDVAHTMSVRGQTDATSGFIRFGSANVGLGVSAGGPLTYGGNTVWHAGNLNPGAYQPALGFTPYNATNPAAYISGITAGMVTGALGYAPANKGGETFSGQVNAPTLAVDPNAYLVVQNTTTIINFDANDYLSYDRTNNKLTLTIGGNAVWSVDASGNMRAAGNITANVAP